MEALLRDKGLWKCTQVLAQDFMKTLEPLTLKERDKIDKALGTIQCFLDSTCKDIARESLTAKDVWKTLKDQLEGQESYNKIYLLTLLYTTKLKEGPLEVDNYTSQWKPSGETFSGARGPHDTYGSSSFFRDPKKTSGISKGPFHEYYQERPATRSFKTQS